MKLSDWLHARPTCKLTNEEEGVDQGALGFLIGHLSLAARGLAIEWTLGLNPFPELVWIRLLLPPPVQGSVPTAAPRLLGHSVVMSQRNTRLPARAILAEEYSLQFLDVLPYSLQVPDLEFD